MPSWKLIFQVIEILTRFVVLDSPFDNLSDLGLTLRITFPGTSRPNVSRQQSFSGLHALTWMITGSIKIFYVVVQEGNSRGSVDRRLLNRADNNRLIIV